MDKESNLILHFFNGRGMVESMRMMLKYSNKDFFDNRLAKEDWLTFKPQTPLGVLPVLEFKNKDGKSGMLTHSHTITRSLASLLGLDGKDFETQVRADESYETLREIVDQKYRALEEKDPELKKQHQQKMHNEIAPKMFGFLEKRAKELGGKSVASKEELVYPDFVLAGIIDFMYIKEKETAEKLKESYPTLFSIKDAIFEQPNVKEYLNNRPVTEW